MGIYMRRFLFAAALSGSLSVVFCAVSSAGQQSAGAMINEQGARVVILKNPSSKTNAQFSSEMAKCESLSRTHMDERVNFYSGCMIYFGNLAQLDGRIVDKAALTPRSTPESVAKRQPMVGRISGTFAVETWRCSEGETLIIDRNRSRVEVTFSSLLGLCDVLIVGGARGPLGGRCPFLAENPLLPYEQFVEFYRQCSPIWLSRYRSRRPSLTGDHRRGLCELYPLA